MNKSCQWILALLLTAASTIGQTFVAPIKPVNGQWQQSASANGFSTVPVISADGRYSVFVSSAKDVVPGQTNSRFLDIFLRDANTGTTTLVSSDSTGAGGAMGNSSYPAISSNAQFVAFISTASNLTAQNTGTLPQLYVRDAVSNINELITVSPAGAPGLRGYTTDCDISGDGRYVAFTSSFTNLAAGGGPFMNLFLRDRITQATQLISVQATNTATNSIGTCESPNISADGQRVVFVSNARDLVVWPGTPPITTNAYFYDRITGTNTCLALDAQQVIGGVPKSSSNVVISADGSAAAFLAISNNPFLLYENLNTKQVSIVSTQADFNFAPQLSGDGRWLLYRAGSNNAATIALWDSQLATNLQVDVMLDGNPAGGSFPVALSYDGSRVVFVSNATNLAADTSSRGNAIYVRDMISGVTRLVAASFGSNSAWDTNAPPVISADGSRVLFVSTNDTYVSGDYNHNADVFSWTWNTGVIELVSARSTDVFNASDYSGTIPSAFTVSSNGNFVAFAANDGNLIPSDTNGLPDVFLRDVGNGVTKLVSSDDNGLLFTNKVAFRNPLKPSLSADGRFVAYIHDYDNVYLRDIQSNSRTLITTTNDNWFTGASGCTISPDGRFVAFAATQTSWTNIYIYDAMNIYIYDASTGTNTGITSP
ncbi:MAG: hypothetical protein JWO95_2033, partial [Verrucomicrobiales bacterium]|nr:hypothetical protein [Verrucomicrobiales bacterium]